MQKPQRFRPVQRYWKAVPTGMSMETPGVRTVTSSPLSSRRQISPRPDRTCQDSLTVAWTVARFTQAGPWNGSCRRLCPPSSSGSPPRRGVASGVSGSGRVCMGTPSREARPQPRRSPLATRRTSRPNAARGTMNVTNRNGISAARSGRGVKSASPVTGGRPSSVLQSGRPGRLGVSCPPDTRPNQDGPLPRRDAD